MTYPAEPIELRRKRLLWRCSHRGIREMDLLMGGFARSRVPGMTEDELSAFEALIDLPDLLPRHQRVPPLVVVNSQPPACRAKNLSRFAPADDLCPERIDLSQSGYRLIHWVPCKRRSSNDRRDKGNGG